MSAARPRRSVRAGNRAIASLRVAERRGRVGAAAATAPSWIRAAARAQKVAFRQALASNPKTKGLQRGDLVRYVTGEIGRVEGVDGRSPSDYRAEYGTAHVRDSRGVLQQYGIAGLRRLRKAKKNPKRKARSMAMPRRNSKGRFVKSGSRTKSRRSSHRRPRSKGAARRRPAMRVLTVIPGGSIMPSALVANPRKRRRKARRSSPARTASGRFRKGGGHRRRRSSSRARRTTTITVRNPRRRRHVRRNPGMSRGFLKAAMSSVMPMGLGGLGGALTGVIDSKFLSTKPLISALSKIALGGVGAAILRRRPPLAFGWAGGVMGSLGYSLGVKVSGGLVAGNAKAAMKGLADLASEDQEVAALLEGMGDLVDDDGMSGDSDADGVGDVGDAADDYATALADNDDDMGDLVDAD